MFYFGAWVYYFTAGWIIFGKLGINDGIKTVLSGFKTACVVIIAGWVSRDVSFFSTSSAFLINGVHALILDLIKSCAVSVYFCSRFSGLFSYTIIDCWFNLFCFSRLAW